MSIEYGAPFCEPLESNDDPESITRLQHWSAQKRTRADVSFKRQNLSLWENTGSCQVLSMAKLNGRRPASIDFPGPWEGVPVHKNPHRPIQAGQPRHPDTSPNPHQDGLGESRKSIDCIGPREPKFFLRQ